MTAQSEVEENVELPDDVLYALKKKPGALEAFKALPASEQKEYLESIDTATMSDIREHRIERLMSKLEKKQ